MFFIRFNGWGYWKDINSSPLQRRSLRSSWNDLQDLPEMLINWSSSYSPGRNMDTVVTIGIASGADRVCSLTNGSLNTCSFL